jgi:peptide/nickel transport system permease protein
MQRYIAKRLLAAVPTMIIVGIVVFGAIHLAPGDPASVIVGDEATPEMVEKMREDMGLNKPIIVQFGIYLKQIATFQLGESVFSGHKVSFLLKNRLQPTLSLAGMGLSMSILIAVPLGVLAAWKFNSWIDRVVMIFALAGYAVPYFFLGYMLMWAFAVKVPIFPAGGYTYFGESPSQWLHGLLLPAMLLSVTSAALITRMTRATMLEVLKEDYVRTARAKGLAEQFVLLRHALRNAANPILTIIGFSIAGLITGVVITETVFAIPGIGRLVVDAIAQRDFPIIQSMALVVAGAYVMVNLLIDVMYVYVDPRIRY